VADTLILAAGQAVDLPEYTASLTISSDGISVNKYLRTGDGKFFAGGDVIQGPRRVCDAVGQGKLAALSMHAYLQNLDMDQIWGRICLGNQRAFSMAEFMKDLNTSNSRLKEPVDKAEINLDHFRESPRAEFPVRPPEQAIKGFEEVIGDVDENEIQKSVERCFSCGTCTNCDICYNFCPDLSVKKRNQSYEIDYTYCKGCTICAEECPRGVIHLKAEES
jgi:Pyruvate/2-oxoacid:ferredoxin oxidoreductase delta subunit